MPALVSTASVGLASQAVVVDVLGDATDAVAAHLRLGAVGIEHLHPGVGRLGGEDEDQAVAADAEVAIAHAAGEFGRVGWGGLGEAIDVDVVVSGPVHLGEAHGRRG